MTPGTADEPMTRAPYEQPVQVLPGVRLVLADNRSPMTLDGTNTWLLGTDRVVIVDPGPDDDRHLDAILGAVSGEVSEVVLTHAHPDHAAGAHRLQQRCGAPVRALHAAHHRAHRQLHEGATVIADDMEWAVLLTPGHTADSVCLYRDDAVLTGDTILGRGTTVVAWPDGNLADYLASLHRLAQLGDRAVLTGHGPILESIAAAATRYLAHREQRLDQVRAAVGELGNGHDDSVDQLVGAVVQRVYADVDSAVWPAARLSVRAQIEYLRAH